MKRSEMSWKQLVKIRKRNDKIILHNVSLHSRKKWPPKVEKAYAQNYRIVGEMFKRLQRKSVRFPRLESERFPRLEVGNDGQVRFPREANKCHEYGEKDLIIARC